MKVNRIYNHRTMYTVNLALLIFRILLLKLLNLFKCQRSHHEFYQLTFLSLIEDIIGMLRNYSITYTQVIPYHMSIGAYVVFISIAFHFDVSCND